MIERRKDFLTRLIVDDMIHNLRAGIRITSDKEQPFLLLLNSPPSVSRVCRILSFLPWLEGSLYPASLPRWNEFECVEFQL